MLLHSRMAASFCKLCCHLRAVANAGVQRCSSSTSSSTVLLRGLSKRTLCTLKHYGISHDQKFQRLLDRLVKEYEEVQRKYTESSLEFTLKQRLGQLNHSVKLIEELKTVDKEIEETQELLKSETDQSMADLITAEIDELNLSKNQLYQSLIDTLLPQEIDNINDVILEIQAGVGGLEAGFFAYELFTMYQRFCQQKNWSLKLLDTYSMGEKQSVNKVRAEISGIDVYRTLKFESGVHRVQRVPQSERYGRIHTSTAVVILLPKPSEIQIEIHPKDIKVDVFRSSGGGGQSVNTTESAVRLTHIPTGTVVECQKERSQLTNRKLAMEILRSRLYEMQLIAQTQKSKAMAKLQIGGANRNEKIRTYNFQQDRITDHRVKLTVNNVSEFLNGGEALLAFLEQLFLAERQERLAEIIENASNEDDSA